jgi:hypothetical protein
VIGHSFLFLQRMEQEGQQEELEKRQIGTKKTHIILLTIDNEYDLCTGLQWHLDNGRQFERKYVGEFRIHQIPLNSAFLRKYNQHFPDLEDWNYKNDSVIVCIVGSNSKSGKIALDGEINSISVVGICRVIGNWKANIILVHFTGSATMKGSEKWIDQCPHVNISGYENPLVWNATNFLDLHLLYLITIKGLSPQNAFDIITPEESRKSLCDEAEFVFYPAEEENIQEEEEREENCDESKGKEEKEERLYCQDKSESESEARGEKKDEKHEDINIEDLLKESTFIEEDIEEYSEYIRVQKEEKNDRKTSDTINNPEKLVDQSELKL